MIIHVNMLLYDRILALYELLKRNLRPTRSIIFDLYSITQRFLVLLSLLVFPVVCNLEVLMQVQCVHMPSIIILRGKEFQQRLKSIIHNDDTNKGILLCKSKCQHTEILLYYIDIVQRYVYKHVKVYS